MERQQRRRSRGAACAALVLLLGVWSNPLQADDATKAATVVVADGRVSVYRDSMEWALFPNHTVAVGETISTGINGYAELRVADGSSFVIYPNSRVVFRKNPADLQDLLDLFLGRVKVYIQKLGGQPNRQRVFTPTAVISVRGTIFDVSVDSDETTLVAVDEGVVTVAHRLLPTQKEIALEAGQSLVIYRNVPLAKAGVDRVKAAGILEDVARTAASIWDRIGRRPGGDSPTAPPGGGSPGGGTPPLPGDTPAPPPPPPPDNQP